MSVLILVFIDHSIVLSSVLLRLKDSSRKNVDRFCYHRSFISPEYESYGSNMSTKAPRRSKPQS